MIVCVCEGLSERRINAHIDAGADSVRALKQRCGAGGDCGSCTNHLKRMIETRRTLREQPIAAK